MLASNIISLFPPLHFGPEALSYLVQLVRKHGTRVLLLHGSRSWNLEETLSQAPLELTSWQIHGEPQADTIDGIIAECRLLQIEVVIAVGGGSVLDAGKAVAAMIPLTGSVVDYLEGIGTQKHPGTCTPWIAVPTTAGTGSEATTNAVLKGVAPNGEHYKRSLRHPAFLPVAIFLDPALQIGMPLATTSACAMDALSQLLESYTSKNATPESDLVVSEGLRHAALGLLALERGQDNLEMRSHLALAALCSGYGLSHAGLGLVHGLAGVIGGLHEIPHGVVCANLIAPAFSAVTDWVQIHPGKDSEVCLQKLAYAKACFARENPAEMLPETLHRLARKFHFPKFSTFGITRADILHIAELGSNRASPALLTKEEILAVLGEAW